MLAKSSTRLSSELAHKHQRDPAEFGSSQRAYGPGRFPPPRAVGTISFKLLAAWARGDACAKFAGISRVLKGNVVLAPYPVMNFAIRLRE